MLLRLALALAVALGAALALPGALTLADLARGTLEGGNVRLATALHRPRVVFAVLGGSITTGHGASSYDKSWWPSFERLVRARGALEGKELVFHSGAVAGTNSNFAALCLASLLPPDVDVVFLEFDINDGGAGNQGATTRRAGFWEASAGPLRPRRGRSGGLRAGLWSRRRGYCSPRCRECVASVRLAPCAHARAQLRDAGAQAASPAPQPGCGSGPRRVTRSGAAGAACRRLTHENPRLSLSRHAVPADHQVRAPSLLSYPLPAPAVPPGCGAPHPLPPPPRARRSGSRTASRTPPTSFSPSTRLGGVLPLAPAWAPPNQRQPRARSRTHPPPPPPSPARSCPPCRCATPTGTTAWARCGRRR